jgi:hypothetical protein
MTVNDIVDLINQSKVHDYGPKNWLSQPTYFEDIFKHIDISTSSNSLFMELGVFTGHTLSLINQNTENTIVYGFDTFSGLPEDWAESSGNVLYNKNAFATSIPVNTDKNTFIVGKVEDTLLDFLKEKNQKIKFIHLDLDLYSASRYALNTIFDYLEDEAIIVIDDVYGLPSWEEHSIKSLSECFDELKYDMEPIATCGWVDGWASMALKIKRKAKLIQIETSNSNTTIVTGLWDLGRGSIDGWAKRDFQQYKDRFFELLETDAQMAIWIPRDLEAEVLAIRGDKPTRIYIRELEDFKVWFPFWNQLQEIRTNPDWYNFAGWLSESPQAALEYYNPMMMCKMFMVSDTAITNPFNSEYFYWIDGGLTSTVSRGYFTHDKVLDKLEEYSDSIQKLTFITYPYDSNDEIHGFERTKMAQYCGVEYVNKISRGGFWGGSKDQIHQLNSLYYSILDSTLNNRYMGADECLFTILTYKHPELIQPFEIEGNGLVWPFFEMLKNFERPKDAKKPFNKLKTNLYVVGFNSPQQFRHLLESFKNSDSNFLTKTNKYFLNNSTDRTTDDEYTQICNEYGFEETKKDNIGICGGRQWCAEHFDASDADYYIFFEDDMLLHTPNDNHCYNGFKNYVPNLYDKTLKIIHDENYDYLKLNFTEVYGDNATQWSWYNIPQNVREQYFPKKSRLPVQGLDPNAPRTKFSYIKRSDDISYIEGEVHYCNWPLWFSRIGNQKVFLDIKWAHPMEQTWMSNVFQMQQNNLINAAILLLSPINHNRIYYYPGQERREN